MKKLIAILAVFAFLGAALFAQDAGTWTIGGNGQINTRIGFLPLYNSDIGAPFNYAIVGASKYGDEHVTFDSGDVKGSLTLGYTKGIIKTEISFNQRGAIGANVQANGENWQFRASKDLKDLINGTDAVGDLWGNYTFQVLEGITLEAAVNKEGGIWEQGFDTWTHHDRLSKNYLLINARPMAGLEVGVKMPDLFQLNATNTTYVNNYFNAIAGENLANVDPDTDDRWPTGSAPDPFFVAFYEAYLDAVADYGKYNFMDDVLRRMVFGAKYSVSPITVAFQFGLNRYGLDYYGGSNRIYFGAKYDIAPGIDAGVYFRGDFKFKGYTIQNPDSSDVGKAVDTSEIIFGGSFNYSSGPLGAGLTFRFNEPNSARTADVPKTGTDQWFRVGLSARYDVLPDNLRAKLGFELEFPILGETTKDNYSKLGSRLDSPRYTFTPEITYNFLGTGAGDDPGVGMKIKYRVEGRLEAEGNLQRANSLTIGFKWSF